MIDEGKTHYRKAFNSPYLSSADIVGPTILTVKDVRFMPDQSKRTKDSFNTVYFAEQNIRPGEVLKPMILNATNNETLRMLAGGSKFIDDWKNIPITVYVDPNVRFGRETVEGLRISHQHPVLQKPELQPNTKPWINAITAYKRDGNFDKVEERMVISDKNKELIREQCSVA